MTCSRLKSGNATASVSFGGNWIGATSIYLLGIHMAKTGAERVKTYRMRRIKAGLTEVRVWVPRAAIAEIKKLAAKLRQKMGV